MRRVVTERSRSRGIGSTARALVAAATATLAMALGIAVAAAPAGASTVDTLKFDSTIPSFAAGTPQSITVDLMNGSSIDTTSSPNGTVALSTSPSVGATGGGSMHFTSGQATFSLTVPTAGTYTITATYTEGSSDPVTVNNPVSQAGVVVYGTATHIAFTPQPSSPNAGSFSVTVSAEDANNNVVADANGESIALSSTDCTLNGAGTPTISDGTYTFSGLSFTQTTSPQSCVVTATDSSETPHWTASSNAVTVPGTYAKLAFTTAPPSSATYGQPMASFVVAAEDASGNVEVGGTADGHIIELLATGCTFSTAPTAPTATVQTNGTATFTGVEFSGSVATSCTITAKDETSLFSVTSATIAVSGTTPTKLGFTTEPPTTAGAGSVLTSFVVSTLQANGVPATGTTNLTDTISLSSTCTLYGTTTAVEIGGAATFSNVSIEKSGSCVIVATDLTAPTIIAAATSTTVTVTAGAPTHLVFTTAPPTTYGSLTAPLTAFAVSVEDAYSNVATTTLGDTDTITITASGCTLTGVTSVVATAGVATFSDVIVTTPGTCTLTATDASRVLTGATASVTVGEPQATLSVTSTSGYLGTPIKLTTSGGSGAGAVTFTVTDGTAKGCAITNGTLLSTSRGTCIVTATKAANGNYAVATSAPTTVTVGAPLPKAQRVVGSIIMGRSTTITVIGTGFYGAPRVISNTAGFSGRVTHDNGHQLTILVTTGARNRAGVHVLVIIEPNGKRTSARFVLRG